MIARSVTLRRENGSSYRIDQTANKLRCPDDVEWLKKQLTQRSLKAYVPTISVHDPKNRKSSNEITDWCFSDGFHDVFKLWSVEQNKFISQVNLSENVRLKSAPTENKMEVGKS